MVAKRRQWLKRTAALGAVSALGPVPALAQSAPEVKREAVLSLGDWRTFDLTTEIEVAQPKGATKLWLPIPDLETSYQTTLGHSWTGNAKQVQVRADDARQVRMVMAEFAGDGAPAVLKLTSRFQTHNRVPGATVQRATEDSETLRHALRATQLIPTHGLVRDTALKITHGLRQDQDKVRAIFDWVVVNAHREPKTRGCGQGNVLQMLETGQLSGKCADLNALFVGLCRASGVPARDVYGLRVAPSATGYRELGANSAKLQGAQHCRAEVWLQAQGWVPMDPADVLKVMRQETPEWIKDENHPLVAPVKKMLFGRWEGNWVGWNTAHDVVLPGSADRQALGFLMYPNGEDARGRFDELAPDDFKYRISAVEVKV